jgi:hypothetical protein
MGGARFIQSARDFPCEISIGGDGRFEPRFALSRWGSAGGLGFDPEETEDGEIRASGRRLHYRGRRRSHRFTLLDGERFEYDIILEREPESNVVSLALAGAELLDFFRQPDFHPDPDLAGSYAVYGRKANGRFGTGKLCHIYAPRIIDAGGRSVRGRLDVIGNRLLITIPETWLADARYPVIVDPVIGTQTIGANTHWVREVGEPSERLYFELSVPVNRFLASETIRGACTAYFYNYYIGDSEAGGRPVLYADGGNYPTERKSADEAFIDFRVSGTNPAGWRSGTFAVDGTIAAGSYLWFGSHTEAMFYPRFDYGARLYGDFHDGTSEILSPYPLYSVSNFYDLKLSMYFAYTASQAYVRSVTQGVAVSDSQRRKAAYARTVSMTVSSAAAIRAVVGAICRFISDIEGVSAEALRGIIIVLRLAGLAGVRDYLLSRFLVSKEEIVIRSRVTRDLVIESRV